MLAPETITFLEGGCATLVGTVSADGEPHAGRGWGVTFVSTDPIEVRLLVDADDHVGLEHLATTKRVAITGADVRTSRSIQIKGTAGALEPATDADRERAARFVDDFFGSVTAVDGTPRELLDRMRARDFVACAVCITEVYDQSPGPGAGTAMPAGGE